MVGGLNAKYQFLVVPPEGYEFVCDSKQKEDLKNIVTFAINAWIKKHGITLTEITSERQEGGV